MYYGINTVYTVYTYVYTSGTVQQNTVYIPYSWSYVVGASLLYALMSCVLFLLITGKLHDDKLTHSKQYIYKDT